MPVKFLFEQLVVPSCRPRSLVDIADEARFFDVFDEHVAMAAAENSLPQDALSETLRATIARMLEC